MNVSVLYIYIVFVHCVYAAHSEGLVFVPILPLMVVEYNTDNSLIYHWRPSVACFVLNEQLSKFLIIHKFNSKC